MKSMLCSILTVLVAILIVAPNTAAQAHRTLTGHTSSVNSVSFSLDGTLASGGEDGTIRLWDVATGQHLRTLTRHAGAVYSSVSFNPDGRTLVSGSWDGIRLWDVNAGEILRTLVEDTWAEIVSFSPDGWLIASAGSEDTIRLWDADTGELLYIITAHTPQTFSVSFSPDEGTLASAGSEDTIRLWDVGPNNDSRPLTGHTDIVLSVAFSPDGSTLASGGKDETVRLWDIVDADSWLGGDTDELLHTLTGHTNAVYSVAFSPDGSTLASADLDGIIRLWDVETGEYLRTLEGHTGSVYSVAFSPDGSTLASGSADGTIRLWELTPAATSNTTLSLSPSPVQSPAIGEQLTLSLKITEGQSVAGYQATLQFDTTALRYVASSNGDYLPASAFFIPPIAAG